MIDFMSFWVNELFGNALLALLGIELLYAIIMFLGRMSIVVMIPILALSLVIFSGILWGSWIVIVMLIFSMIYLGYGVIKFIAPYI